MKTDLAVALLLRPDGDKDAPADAQDAGQFAQGPHAAVARRQVTATWNERQLNSGSIVE